MSRRLCTNRQVALEAVVKCRLRIFFYPAAGGTVMRSAPVQGLPTKVVASSGTRLSVHSRHDHPVEEVRSDPRKRIDWLRMLKSRVPQRSDTVNSYRMARAFDLAVPHRGAPRAKGKEITPAPPTGPGT